MFDRRVVFCRAFLPPGGRERFAVQLLYCNARTITSNVSISFRNQLSPDKTFVQPSAVPARCRSCFSVLGFLHPSQVLSDLSLLLCVVHR